MVVSKFTKHYKDKIINKVKYAKALICGRNNYPPRVRKILEKYGNDIIASIIIKKTPVPAIIQGTLNAISLGKFNENMETNQDDKMLFHLYLDAILQNGVHITIEKNEVIQMTVNGKGRVKSQETESITPPQGLTLLKLMENTNQIMGQNFFTYSAKTNNCQDFILAILQSNHISSTEYTKFIKQDADKMFKGLENTSRISDAVTNLGSLADVAINGAGITFCHKSYGRVKIYGIK